MGNVNKGVQSRTESACTCGSLAREELLLTLAAAQASARRRARTAALGALAHRIVCVWSELALALALYVNCMQRRARSHV
mmetsp:Transcript_7618/g.23776  ORF Transcript_7618/g.23776 Transcript_7618/m.23776 type:complete len:80 (-) Transcript_7618:128-367(-)